MNGAKKAIWETFKIYLEYLAQIKTKQNNKILNALNYFTTPK